MQHERAATWKGMLLVVLLYSMGLLAVIVLIFKITPWPSALLIRRAFTKEAAKISEALEKKAPPNIAERLNENYDSTDWDAFLDVFFPASVENSATTLPTIVWVHGGAWVSGTKDQIDPYARILASKNFAVVSVNYSIAPGAKYPKPVRQVDKALAYLQANARRLHLDPTRFFLAGDSAGSHIAAQVANAIVVPDYARTLGLSPALSREQLRGAILFCGAYGTRDLNLDGPFGGFLHTVLWSYSGSRHFMSDPRFASASVIDYVTKDFPPVFISAGNADPLLSQSIHFADRLTALGVPVDRLFYPENYNPPLEHEYQFNLDRAEGEAALQRVVQFVESH